MLLNKLIKTLVVFLIAIFIYTPASFSGGLDIPDTDNLSDFGAALFYFFDLRDRESFVQLTNVDTDAITVHVQIWDVSNNCNENNFFDTYTGNDTHVYNMRDIRTNDGNPSGAVLPDNAYGFVSIFISLPTININRNAVELVGNFRVIDITGYEYRTNAVNTRPFFCCWGDEDSPHLTFNYNTKGNITLSDVVGIAFDEDEEIFAAEILDTWISFDIDILNENEVVFSCRNVIFACTDQDNPLYEELLDESGDASVASFEYGINNAIPNSRGGELLCPGNTISDGFVTLNMIDERISDLVGFVGFIGLNSGNSRGSMDSFWYESAYRLTPGDDDDG